MINKFCNKKIETYKFKKNIKYHINSFGFYWNVTDRIFKIRLQLQIPFIIIWPHCRYHNHTLVFLITNDMGHFLLFWVQNSLQFVQLSLVNLFFNIVNFLLLFKLIFKLLQFTQSLIVNFLEVFILDFQHLHFLWPQSPCCVVRVCVIRGLW